MNKEDKLLEVLNKALKDSDLNYKTFNKIINVKSEEDLIELEKQEPKLGLTMRDKKHCMSTLSLISTITDIFCNKRLAFEFNDYGNFNRVLWFREM